MSIVLFNVYGRDTTGMWVVLLDFSVVRELFRCSYLLLYHYLGMLYYIITT